MDDCPCSDNEPKDLSDRVGVETVMSGNSDDESSSSSESALSGLRGAFVGSTLLGTQSGSLLYSGRSPKPTPTCATGVEIVGGLGKAPR